MNLKPRNIILALYYLFYKYFAGPAPHLSFKYYIVNDIKKTSTSKIQRRIFLFKVLKSF